MRLQSANMTTDHPDSDSPEEEELERERLKQMLTKVAAVSAAMEGYVTARETAIADPVKQKERERERDVMLEAIAGVADDFAEIRRELRSALGQPHNEPSDDSTHH
jgi:hypothetical protein